MRANRIFILGHFGGSNCGDAAMLLGFLDGLESRGHNCSVAIVTKSVEELDKQLESLELRSITDCRAVPSTIGAVLRSIFWADLLVLCGGTHFEDALPGKRRWRHYVYLLRYLLVFLIGTILGRGRVALGMGIGPIRYRTTRVLLRCFDKVCSHVTLRDGSSGSEYEEVTGRTAPVCIDLAGLIDSARFAEPGNRTRADAVTLGISVTNVRVSGEETEAAQAIWLERLADGLAQAWSNNGNICYRLLLIREGDRESDVPVSEALRADLLGRGNQIDVATVKGCSDPVNAIRELGNCDAVIAMRYHSAVLAYLSQVPTLILPYHEKLRQVSDDLGIPKRAVIDPRDSEFATLLATGVSDILRAPAEFRPSLPIEEARSRAEKNLESIFQQS